MRFLLCFAALPRIKSLFQSLYLKVLTFTVSSVLSLYRGVLTLSNIFWSSLSASLFIFYL